MDSMPMGVGLVGAVLVGGRSRRMGTDKALLVVDGVPMGRRCVDVLSALGCDPVFVIGAGAAHHDLGGLAVPDDVPDGGPAAAVATALRHANGRPTVVLPADLPRVDVDALSPLLHAATDHPHVDVVLATVAGRRQLPIGLWRPHPSLGDPAALAGASIHGIVERLTVIDVECDERLADADRPEDLPDHQSDRPPTR
jgi:molybdopterin-guanine dinucleotide biosynthesis protein A